jgi:hypothetical protein
MNRLGVTFKKIAYGFGILILVVILVNFQQRISEMNHLEGQLKLIQTQGTAVMHTQESLLTQVAYATSDEAVKKWAYSEGRWYLENETPIILLPAGNATPTPESVEQSPAAEVDNWQVWWELFFGQKN